VISDEMMFCLHQQQQQRQATMSVTLDQHISHAQPAMRTDYQLTDFSFERRRTPNNHLDSNSGSESAK